MFDHAVNTRNGQRVSADTLTVPRYNSTLDSDDPASLPSNAFSGQLVLDEADWMLKIYMAESDSWLSVSGGGGGGGSDTSLDFEEWYAGYDEVPAAELGEAGDYYLDPNGDIYEK